MLYLVPTPLGNFKDFTFRAIETLKSVYGIIVEEKKVGLKYLKYLEIENPNIYILNEHTHLNEIKSLAELCRNYDLALISDTGTPGFCDPGPDLIKIVRKEKIPIQSLPGPSSLTLLISLSSYKIKQFYFYGFLPQETKLRYQEWNKLKSIHIPLIMMDTPYRLYKTLIELKEHLPQRKILLGVNLTQKDEWIMEDRIERILNQLPIKKGNFILLIHSE